MHLKLALILVLSFFASQVYGDGFGSIVAEKDDLLKRIQCSRQSTTPAGDGLGSLWGCYNRTEDVKLWINEQVSNRNTVKNVKLMVVNYHGSKMDITGRIWGGIIAENYGGSNADKIKSVFKECAAEQKFADKLTVLVTCTKGPKADEHMIVVTSK